VALLNYIQYNSQSLNITSAIIKQVKLYTSKNYINFSNYPVPSQNCSYEEITSGGIKGY